MGFLSSVVALVSRLVTPVLLLLAAAIAAYTFAQAIIWTPPTGDRLSEANLAALLDDQDVVAAGMVTDAEGRTIPGATVVLALHGGGGETLWRINRPVGRSGTFEFRRRDLPALPNAYPGTVAVEAPNHLTATMAVLVRIEATTPGVGVSEAQITPRRLQLYPATLNPWLTLVLLLPAIFGLVSAVLHLLQYSTNQSITAWFAFGTAALWSAVATVFALVYVIRGYTLVPLFWSDLLVSSGVVVFSFIGTVIYVAYSVLQRGPGFYFDATEDERRHIVLTLGGRVLMAPYIALVAWATFAGTFPTLRTGPAAAFFAFFTGLWIKPVVEALNDIGSRFLSPEQRQKVVDRLVRESAPEAPPAQTTSAALLRPEPALISAIAEARKRLLPLPGVVGVDAGLKVSSNDVTTVRQAIVVYVYEKKPQTSAGTIPSEINGIPTDIVALAGRAPAGCDSLCPKLSWKKIHEDTAARMTNAAAPTATVVGNVVLVHDPDASLFNPFGSGESIFDVLGCYQAARSVLGDSYDFVSFVIDNASGLRANNTSVGDYHVPVFSDIQGTNYHAFGNPGTYAETAAWNATKLRACSVLSFAPELSLYRHLHELGHYWTAYATIRSGSATESHVLQISADAAQGRYHWGEHFDDGRSCMDYDTVEWVSEGGNRYRKRFVGENDFVYCPLDLYLMGLIPANDVGPIRVLRSATMTTTPDVYTAEVQPFTVNEVIASCGPRLPAFAAAPTQFRQALVVVSRTTASGDAYARRLDNWRASYMAAFHRATGGRASLDTSL